MMDISKIVYPVSGCSSREWVLGPWIWAKVFWGTEIYWVKVEIGLRINPK